MEERHKIRNKKRDAVIKLMDGLDICEIKTVLDQALDSIERKVIFNKIK